MLLFPKLEMLRTKKMVGGMTRIYGLFSGRDGLVRYVGLTTYSCEGRFDQHVRDSWLSRAPYPWMRNEWKLGFPVECVRLATCENGDAAVVEREWINKFPYAQNLRKRNEWGRTTRAPVVPAIKVFMRRYLFNVGGYHGISYDKGWDTYRVMVFNGREPEWLSGGDDIPGWGPTWHFNDLPAALEARERRRKWLRAGWLPDREPIAA